MAILVAGVALHSPVVDAQQGDTVTFTSQMGASLTTPTFFESGPWTWSWSFTSTQVDPTSQRIPCDVDIFPMGGPPSDQEGTSDHRLSGSGTAYDFAPGMRGLQIDGSGCQWSVTVAPSTQQPLGSSSTFSSTTSGNSALTPRMGEDTSWTLSWTYSCPPGGNSSPFDLEVKVPPSARTQNTTSQSFAGTGTSGQGSQPMGAGEYSFVVQALHCTWSITTSPQSGAGADCNSTLPSGSVVGTAATPDGRGYWIASSDGTVTACGDAPALGNSPRSGIVAIAADPLGVGYWLATSWGSVYNFGEAVPHGGVNGNLAEPIVAMAADPQTGGYWLLGADGGVFSFDAPFFGSTGNIRLNKPAVGMQATSDGQGYLFVASDGGVFTYGDAPFYGSAGNVALRRPVVGMAIDSATGGYWLDAADGGIFAFNAQFHGSTGNLTLAMPCVGMIGMSDGAGYRFVAADGGIFAFGDAGYEGSAA